MGIDLEQKKRGRRKRNRRLQPKSKNVYLTLLHKLYSYLERRTQSRFNRVIAHRLAMANESRPVLSLKMMMNQAFYNES